MYNMLARMIMQEVDTNFLAELKKMQFPQNTGNKAIDEAYHVLFKSLSQTKESVIDDLAVDYARTFLGIGTMESRAAYPFESVYTSEKGLLMQDAHVRTYAIYLAEGLVDALANPHNEGVDHLYLELLFMKELSLRAARALEAGEEDAAFKALLTQKHFLADHLLNWVPIWAADVPLYAKELFYPACAKLTAAYLQDDFELIVEMLGKEE